MPEGDTVFRAARRLHEGLAGEVVRRFEVRVPRSALADLRGETVHEVVPRGKHLLMRIGEYTLHSHLKMEGRWHVYRPGEKWRAPAFQARAVVGTAPADAVGFELAMVEVLPTADEERIVGHLGPDPLATDWDPADAARRVAADSRAIHVALLDQRNVAGFGNEYVNEILFVRGIRPTALAADVDTVGIIETGARMIQANRDRQGRTFTGDSRPGQQTWVYRREHKPCRRCGTLIEKSDLGARATSERIIFWCPVCQP
ncbi:MULTISPECIES: DNA-formamidopyrimidine glycosylase family protein [unclassified Microbacterium]|uniref:DNA-formamidopyrimidine glycosylase family protein n=1 Tax=unclassified Microbacterium TaxID=2609290 RepID=UPI00386486B4